MPAKKQKPPLTQAQKNAIQQISTALKSNLSDDLLHPKIAANRPKDAHITYGHCYTATEAMYHAIGGASSGFVPARGRDSAGIVHWWLELETNEGIVRIDVTAEQYSHAGQPTPYDAGLPYGRKGFLTKEPSKRTQKLLAKSGLDPKHDPWLNAPIDVGA